MTIPALTLSIAFASLYGALYHLIRGGGGRRLLLYLVLSWLGFGLGHWVGVSRGWIFMQFGAIDLGPATVGSYLVLAIGDWLSRREVPPAAS
ncbi:MAG: hypothetical protein A2Y54_11155 [Chloroflexi bacterium RBG_16_51_16]|nr:MAG: hypothetical protein A2Y54_11155 [Chloroflexi bacterium RBG_16_51_16]